MKALNVADYIINKCIDFGKPISNFKLQEFMFFVHLDFLRKTGKKLITDEKFQAWGWGPTIKSVYDKFRIFGSNALSIHEENDDLDLSDYKFSIIDKRIENLLELRPWELVDKSNTSIAWILTYQDGVGNKREICDQLIELQAYNEDILKSRIVKEALNGIEKAVKKAVEAINNEIENTDATNYKVSKFLSEQWEKNGLGNNRDKDREEAAYAHFLQSKNIQKAFENVGAAMYNAMKNFDEENKNPIETKASLKSKKVGIWRKIWK